MDTIVAHGSWLLSESGINIKHVADESCLTKQVENVFVGPRKYCSL